MHNNAKTNRNKQRNQKYRGRVTLQNEVKHTHPCSDDERNSNSWKISSIKNTTRQTIGTRGTDKWLSVHSGEKDIQALYTRKPKKEIR